MHLSSFIITYSHPNCKKDTRNNGQWSLTCYAKPSIQPNHSLMWNWSIFYGIFLCLFKTSQYHEHVYLQFKNVRQATNWHLKQHTYHREWILYLFLSNERHTHFRIYGLYNMVDGFLFPVVVVWFSVEIFLHLKM